MSNLFDDFAETFPENDDQIRLRERFSSVADSNEIGILLFDPKEYRATHRIHLTSGEKEIEAAYPELVRELQQDMLRSARLDIPTTRNDPRLVVERHFENGVRSSIFTVTRSDESYVPVYYETETDSKTPRLVYLMSFEEAEETVLLYRDLDEYRTRLCDKLNIGDAVLRRMKVEDLKAFDSTLDDIIRL